MMDFLDDVWYYTKAAFVALLGLVGLLLVIASVTAIGFIPLLFGLQWLAYITFPIMFIVSIALCITILDRVW